MNAGKGALVVFNKTPAACFVGLAGLPFLLEKAWWGGLDSNQCIVSETELQSVAFDRSATPPNYIR